MARNYTPSTKYLFSNHFSVLIVLLIIFVSVGYFIFLGKPGEEAERLRLLEEYAQAKETWAEAAPASYRYVVDRDCDCAAETDRAYTVTATHAGRVAEFPIPVEASSGEMLTGPRDPVWIEDLFSMIGRALDGGALVNVGYNYLYGYPEAVDLSPGDDAAAAGDRFEVRDFEVLRTP